MQQETIQGILSDFSQQDTQKKAIDTLFQYLYFHLSDFGLYRTTEDIRSDFLLWLYPRLSTIIAGYKPNLSLFSTYLRMSVTYHWKIFSRKNREQAIYTALVQADQQQKAQDNYIEQNNLRTYETYAASEIPAYTVSTEKEQAIQETIKWKLKRKQIYSRYILELVCKSCFCIDDALLHTVAGHLSVPVREVERLIADLKEQAYTKDTQYQEWAEKRDFYYVRYKSAAIQLRSIDTTHTSVVEKLKIQQNYNYNLWQRYLKRMQVYSRGPSNRSLAKRLGFSRGTIDNDLADLKKAWYGTSHAYLPSQR
jgi:hypothetical protein